MNNNAALGYMILAARVLGLDEQTINRLEREMTYQFDVATEEDAEKAYRQL